MIMKNLGQIEPGGRSLLLFVVSGGDLGRKTSMVIYLWCAISCDNRILTYLLLEIGKGVYEIIST